MRKPRQESRDSSYSFRMGSIEFRQMQPADKEVVVPLLTQIFGDNEPLNAAYNAKYGISKVENLRSGTQLWSKWLENANNTSLSTVIIDHEKHGEIIGAIISQDAGVQVENVEGQPVGTPLKGKQQLSHGQAYLQLEEALKKKAPQEVQKLFEQTGKTTYVWAGIVKPQYRGRNLVPIGCLHGFRIARSQGYRHCCTVATNINSMRVANKFPGAEVRSTASIDVKKFEVNGCRPYQLVDEENRYARLLLYGLSKDNNTVELVVKPKL